MRGLGLLALLLAACSQSAAAPAGHPKLLAFHADWCAACRVEARAMRDDPELAAALARFDRVEIDLSHEDAHTLALEQQYQVTQLPTLIAQGAGAPVRIVGTSSPATLAAQLDAVR